MTTGPGQRKIDRVVSSLETNPTIVVARKIERGSGIKQLVQADRISDEEDEDRLGHYLCLRVYPVRPTYDIDELNRLLEGLTPGIDPTYVSPFKREGAYLQLGGCSYLEAIGRLSTDTTITLDSSEGLCRSWAVDTAVQALMQTTVIILAPTVACAQEESVERGAVLLPTSLQK